MIEAFDGIPASVQRAIANGMSPLSAFRQAEGRSAHDVAVAANIDLKRLTAIENGQYPTTAEATALAEVLLIDPSWLGPPTVRFADDLL